MRASLGLALAEAFAQRSDEVALCLVGRDGELQLTYRDLAARVNAVAALLRSRCGAGDRALLLYPHGVDYAVALCACVVAGVVAVPAYPPAPRRGQSDLRRLRSIVRDADPRITLVATAIAPLLGTDWPTPVCDTSACGTAPGALEVEPRTGGALALLQYTSGSTGAPRGVMLSNHNLCANIAMIREAFGTGPSSRVLSWLPLYHDMGLIGCLLGPLVWGASCTLLSPLHALAKPAVWLREISNRRITTCAAPNFAYDLATRRITPAECEGLDLASWSVAIDAAEPVQRHSLVAFADRFARHGFAARSLRPTYGLAEATVFVTTVPADDRRTLDVDRDVLARGAIAGSHDASRARGVVSVGVAPPGTEVRVVDPEDRRARADRTVGEVWVAGPHVAAGYWNNPDASAATFGAVLAGSEQRWLRTGDLGFADAGHLYIVGRSKDSIIIRGRNHAAEDIEDVVRAAAGSLQLAGCAAFSVDGADGEELVVVAEIEPHQTGDRSAARTAIMDALLDVVGLAAREILFVRRGALARTSSGKVQRHACRAMFLVGELVRPEVPSMPEALSRATLLAAQPDERVGLLERYLLDAVAEALGRRDVERDVPLTALGLDSLKLIEVRFRLEDELGLVIEGDALPENPTVAKLARALLAVEPSRVEVSAPARQPEAAPVARSLQFSVMFFSGDDDAEPADRYGLLLEAARFADEHGFRAIWIPERHFHSFGGLFPNPATIAAALAVATKRVRIRAGSIVTPLHDAVRIAEEWSVVDNLSNGRVDLAFATGRNVRDFVLAPDRYRDRLQYTVEGISDVRKLWAGRGVTRPDGMGRMSEVRTRPLPVQREFAIWLTSSERVETFLAAAELGASILTALIGQPVEELAAKIDAYRAACAQHGHAMGHVTAMVHAYLDESSDAVRAAVERPFKAYLKSFTELWQGQHAERAAQPLSARVQQELLDTAFERYFRERALFGTEDEAAAFASRLAQAGVTELACLIDFGVERKATMASLERLARVQARFASAP